MTYSLLVIFTFLTSLFSPPQAPLTEPQKEFFENNIRPILANDCQTCHADAKMGGLRLTSREEILKGGASGPAITPGNPDSSLLMSKVREKDQSKRMPKSGLPLNDIEINYLEKWIRDGAYWPQETVESADAKAKFFEESVHSVIAFKCFTCHTNSKMGGLQLDTLEGMLKGGNSGPAIVPGDPDKSLLITAVKRTGALQMPKNGSPLSSNEIAAIVKWVKDGAYWPQAAKEKPFMMTADQQKLWSIQPLKKPEVPKVKDTSWPLNDIDRFVLANLESQGLKPVSAASRRTLIRRASFDLTGLPPTFDEVKAFENDKSPNAWDKLIDRLQSSPRYGERWARHWMDVSRFGEDDYSAAGQQRVERYNFAYTYRDWLIDVLNKDMAYDTFVRAQLAGDMMDDKVRDQLIPGLGFNGLGVWNSMAMAAQIERANDWFDRVDVTSKAFLGLTVGCARCHDHKYDAIPTKDYYRLAGVFASSQYKDYPLVAKSIVDDSEAKQKVLDEKQRELNDLLNKAGEIQAEVYFLQGESYMVAAWRVGAEKKATVESIAEQYKLDVELLQRWVRFLKKPPVNYGYLKQWQEMTARGGKLAEAQKLAHEFYQRIVSIREEKAKIKAENETEIAKTKDPNAKDLFDPLPNGKKRSLNIYLTALKGIDQEKGELYSDVFENDLPDPNQIGDPERQPGLLKFTGFALEKRMPTEWANQIARMRADIDAFKKAMGEHYPFAYGIGEAEKPVDLRVFLRGNPDNFGEEAPRAFLAMLTNGQAKPFSKGSGRLELAEDILKQPIAYRVVTNRIWAWLMGTGIVLTPNNFGMAGSKPSNPELLDYLAVKFQSDGMSFKKLQKFIMLSRTYQLAADDTDANQAKDPDNRFYWKANTKRLDAEGVWDYLFTAGGNLDLDKVGGPSKELEDGMRRRGVYGTSSRMFPNTFQLTFDFQTPTNSVERRFTTIIPQQRLFFLNSPIVHKEAALMAERASTESTQEAQVKKLFEIVLQREPSATELSTSVEFMSSLPPPEKTAESVAVTDKPESAGMDKNAVSKEGAAENGAAAEKTAGGGKTGRRGQDDSGDKKEKESPQKDTPLKHLGWALLSSNEFIYIN
jgi:hypothetical protein